MTTANPYLDRIAADLAPWQERGMARLAEQRAGEEADLRAALERTAARELTARAGQHREAALGVVMLLRRRFDAWDVIWRGEASTLDQPARPADLEQRRSTHLAQTKQQVALILLILLAMFLVTSFISDIRTALPLSMLMMLLLLPARFTAHRRTREAAQIARAEQEHRQETHDRALAARAARSGDEELPSWHPALGITEMEAAVDSLAEAVDTGDRDLEPLQPLLRTRPVGSFPDALPEEAKALLAEFAREDEQWLGHLRSRRIG